MNTVTIYNKTGNEISLILGELKSHGLVANEHYEFRYFHNTWDYMTGEVPKKCEFTFKDDKLASWFILRWG
jgi:hypothetical protein